MPDFILQPRRFCSGTSRTHVHVAVAYTHLSGYSRSQTSKYLKGDGDLTGGFSGGPLVEYISGAGYVAIGIHKDGSTIDGSSYPTSYTGALLSLIHISKDNHLFEN